MAHHSADDVSIVKRHGMWHKINCVDLMPDFDLAHIFFLSRFLSTVARSGPFHFSWQQINNLNVCGDEICIQNWFSTVDREGFIEFLDSLSLTKNYFGVSQDWFCATAIDFWNRSKACFTILLLFSKKKEIFFLWVDESAWTWIVWRSSLSDDVEKSENQFLLQNETNSLP